ncbi:MAG TPA: AraC family transcriptional regulator, partial [Ruminococcaceae bacterium]|nr:AraC family transcriptional regulator [Oscillospiraceae bacterium]
MHTSIYPVLAAQTRLPFYLSGAGISDPEYHVVRPDGLVSCQILFTRSGSGVLRIDGREIPQTPGSLFFLTPGVLHEYFPDGGGMWETAWVVFRGEYLRE